MFLGVSTGRSAIQGIFPLWMRELGRPDVGLVGVDLQPHAAREAYRRVVAAIASDPVCVGGLVTTHKIDVVDAARDLFAGFDRFARALGEVSAIVKTADGLHGSATDPIAAGITLATILGPGYFGRTGGEVLCFGAGGSAAAITLHLLDRGGTDRPRRIVIVNRSQVRLERLRELVAGSSAPIEVDLLRNEDPNRNDELLATMPAGTLVVNATGMGKDRPGSPLTDAAIFPERAIAWELNYRGDLRFLRQAAAQTRTRAVHAEDGWTYFVRGWIEVLARVLGFDITPDRFDRLASIAATTGRPLS